MWRLTASVSESCLIPLALHVTISDDDSHIVSESQTLPADESVESAGMCHCFPRRASVVRAFSAQRQHREVVSKQWHAQCSSSHASTCIVLWKRTSVHVVVCMRSSFVMSSPPRGRSVRSYTHERARLSRTAQAIQLIMK
jgi:hypothetical protein